MIIGLGFRVIITVQPSIKYLGRFLVKSDVNKPSKIPFGNFVSNLLSFLFNWVKSNLWFFIFRRGQSQRQKFQMGFFVIGIYNVKLRALTYHDMGLFLSCGAGLVARLCTFSKV